MVDVSVQAMHVEVIQQLQRQGGYRKDKVFSQQIDWALNNGQDAYIVSKIRPNKISPLRFEVDQKSVNSIQSIIVPNKELRVIKDIVTRGYQVLPNDFAYLVNDRSVTIGDCKETFTDSLESYVHQLRVFKFPDSTKAGTPFYTNINVSKGATVKQFTSVGYPSIKDKDWFVEPILNLFKEHGYQAYWQTYGELYKEGSFIVIVEVLSDTITMTIDGGATKAPDEIISRTVQRYKELEGDEVPNRLYKQDYVYNAVLSSKYMEPIPTSPVTSLAQNKIFVHNSKKFIVSKIIVDYIRKPRRISLSLNSSCELAGETHREICDLAVEFLKRDIQSEDYVAKVQENANQQLK